MLNTIFFVYLQKFREKIKMLILLSPQDESLSLL